jgi:hypothetical protein
MLAMDKKLLGKLKKIDLRLATFMGIFVVAGTIGIILAKADTPTTVKEAENGTISGNASKLTIDGRQVVRFDGPTSSYSQIGTSDYQTGTTLTQDTLNNQYTPGIYDSTSLINQHVNNFGIVDILSSLTINADGTYDIELNEDKLDQRFGSNATSLLKDYSSGVVLIACCNFEQLTDPATRKLKPDGRIDLNNSEI